jgi:hypothetical protein
MQPGHAPVKGAHTHGGRWLGGTRSAPVDRAGDRVRFRMPQDSFKLSTDPQFVDKVVDVVGLYHNPPEKAVVLCVDKVPDPSVGPVSADAAHDAGHA